MANAFLSLYFLLIIFTLTGPAQAQEFLSDREVPGKQKVKISFKNSSEIIVDSNDAGSSPARSKQFEASLVVPVFQNDNSTYALSAKTRHLHFDNLPANANFIALENLYSHQFGFSWSLQEEDGNTWGLGGTYGSASDKPFEGTEVRSTEATLTRKIIKSPTAYWLYFLSYSNNRAVLNNIPLPGFAFVFSDEEKTTGGALGIPFLSYWWRPTPKLFSSIYVLPSSLQMQAGYMLAGPFQANLKLEYGQQAYMRSGRQNLEERLFYDTKKIATSLKTYFGPARFFEIELARIFDRSLYNGKSAFDLTSDRMGIPNEWQFIAALQASF